MKICKICLFSQGKIDGFLNFIIHGTKAKFKRNNSHFMYLYSIHSGGARGVLVIVEGFGYGDTSSNPGLD